MRSITFAALLSLIVPLVLTSASGSYAGGRASEPRVVCPGLLIQHKTADCIGEVSRRYIPFDGSCQFVGNTIYRATCSEGSIVLEPCVDGGFISARNYSLSACVNDAEFLGNTFVGDCRDTTTCLTTESPTAAPTTAATFPPTSAVADRVVLPSPPLPPNEFADTILDVDLAHETVFLAGRLIYRMTNATDAAAILPAKYKLHFFKDTGSTEVMVITSESSDNEMGKVMVIFRGTDATADGDWATNANAIKVSYGPDGKKLEATVVAPDFWNKNVTYSLQVHGGFNGVFSDNLYEEVLSVLNSDEILDRRVDIDGVSHLYYNETIHFMGHSLGGANAQLFGVYYAHFHPNIKTYVTTLGSPRQGNFAYKMLVESMPNLAVWRMVLCGDLVARIPNVRYYHAGHVMWKRCNATLGHAAIDTVEAYYRQAGDARQLFADVPLSWVLSLNEPSIVADHMGAAYMEWLSYAALEKGAFSARNWTFRFENIPPSPAPTQIPEDSEASGAQLEIPEAEGGIETSHAKSRWPHPFRCSLVSLLVFQTIYLGSPV